jgi:hypothetical protein
VPKLECVTQPTALQRLLVSGDLSYVLSVGVALDAHDIPHAEEERGLPWAPQTAILVPEADVGRATMIARALQTTPRNGGLAADRRYVVFLRTVVGLFLAGWLAYIIWSVATR